MPPAILASRDFAIRDWSRVPADMETRLSCMMRQSVPNELRPKCSREKRTSWTMNVDGAQAARNRSVLDMSRNGMSNQRIAAVFALDKRYVRRILPAFREQGGDA